MNGQWPLQDFLELDALAGCPFTGYPQVTGSDLDLSNEGVP